MNKLFKNKKKILILAIPCIGFFFIGIFLARYEPELKPRNLTSCELKTTCLNCNVLLISPDSLRADRVTSLGYKRFTTPNFDKLTESGVLFKNYFPAAYLTPISEMSLHTGMYPTSSSYTKFEEPLTEKYTTLAQILNKDSYRTFAVHSSPEFVNYTQARASFSRGFESYSAYNPKLTVLNSRRIPELGTVVEKLDEMPGKKFFGWISVGNIHWPYGNTATNIYADPEYDGLFKGEILEWQVFQNIYNGIYYPKKQKLSQEDHQYINDMYDNGIRQFDDFLGDLMKKLEEKDLLKNTVIIIASEHGEGLGERGYYAHYDLFDEQVRTPLLIVYPNSKKGTVSSLVSSIDVLPTLLQILGIGIPDQAQGKSVLPIICNEEPDTRDTVIIERNPLWEESPIRSYMVAVGVDVKKGNSDVAIRTNEWKLILRKSRNVLEKESWWGYVSGEKISIPEKELYDLINDPKELKNVADENPEVIKDLEAKLIKWEKEADNNNPKESEHPFIQEYF